MSTIERNLMEVRGRIEKACETSNRDPSEVTLIAVSKTVSIDRLKECYDLGQRHFGESRLQEALPKIEALPADITWHFIGTLQSNKALRVAQVFDVIHTLDNDRQLREIAKQDRAVDALIECNLAQENQKSGIFLTQLDEMIRLGIQCDRVRVRGLMTIGPANLTPQESRSLFFTLKQVASKRGLAWLSMGMSSDYEVAVQEGATHVRVGSAIFGGRP